MNDIMLPKPKQQESILPKSVDSPLPPVPPEDTPPPVNTPEKRRWGWIILGIIVAVLLAVAGSMWWWYDDALKAKSNSPAQVSVVVAEGDSWDAVIGALEEKSLIKSSLAGMIYIRLNNQPDLKAGTYLIAANQSLPNIVAWLGEGKIDTRRLTILPGKTLKEVKDSLVKQGYKEAEVQAAFAASYDHPLLNDKPAGATLEGYIFPDTYFVAANEPLKDVLRRTFDEFEKQIEAKNIRPALAAAGFNLHEGIIFASIIEREVGKPDDRRQVAQVLLKRYREGMMLGADATYEYAAKILGVEPSPSLDSPYNTRKHVGLPPGPISTVPISALEAFINPAPGDYLYYVSGDDGTTYFSHTVEEHEQKTRQYCTTACFGIE